MISSVEQLISAWGGACTPGSSSVVVLPTQVFVRVLKIAFGLEYFSEVSYLEKNPDVAEAVASGRFESARAHFLRSGIVEGRSLPEALFDEREYLSANADVAAAVSEGSLSSGHAHWVSVGWLEGRPTIAASINQSV